MVEAKDHQDIGDDVMQCINHPFTKNPGGICALCLQEKLGNLVTSSFPLPKHFPSSSSSSPSFRSDSVGSSTTATATAVAANTIKTPFPLPKKMLAASSSSSASTSTANIVYKRSQSTTAYRDSDFTPKKRNGFWSFLHLHHSSNKKVGNFQQPTNQKNQNSSSLSSSSSSMSKKVVTKEPGGSSSTNVIVEEDGSPNIVISTVSRSRSIGCGSRSFSGDFFERITNGFGDCTLRRVESQREVNNNGKISNNGVREMVRCGGIFSGFMIMTSSSSSSSSSGEHHHHHHQNMVNNGGRNRRWGAFASPMRAFTTTTKRGRTISDSSKNITPNLSAIPSLLVVKS